MDVTEKVSLVSKPPTEEVVTQEELLELFKTNSKPKHYIGIEISGFLHLGSLISTGFKINDFVKAGVDCTVFLADWHTLLNEKMGGNFETIRKVSKYYEDAGYFGHINCSDNLNEVMEQYGVQKKKGWHAINLFFNTSAGGQNSVLSDESFARPGDYVIFRALKDLTCGTTACPSDIEPANDWNPSDIYVRVYNEKNRYLRGIILKLENKYKCVYYDRKKSTRTKNNN